MNRSKNPLPKYATEGAAGMDLHADIDSEILLKPMEIKMIPTGIHIGLPVGYEAQIRARSGLSSKFGITLINGIGTIDSDYRGEIKVPLINLGSETYVFQPGERICQMVVKKYITATLDLVDILDDTDRGQGGFGHSGKK
ncbi:dUTP diphosphatase [Alkalibacter rhizosphaerae]|uniref:Deoxyuridine 5'-triphosphate nucleotidohydrolase n=2 Tax=Alkalibacter rhizosphaerae TaxID=2815577 RepID=A0A974XIY1_9FIRM|nr:dUTP diphosphatase [Alkalibacter rhizosphaerae]